ncbi:RHS repeat-associated core domain-containing protein, partial [Pseudomonas psychrophila]
IVWQAKYRVWGNTVEEISEPYYLEQQNLRFQGQYLDREIGLHYNIFRFYDPDVGRFTTTDPIGLAGGFNLYQYAANPIGWLDPWGLSACAPTHHIATNKHAKWTPKYRVLFEKNGLGKFKNGKSRRDVLNDPLNKVDVPGHKGPHPEGMHAEIYKRLQNASRKGPDQFKAELAELRKEALDPTSTLNKILRKVDL